MEQSFSTLFDSKGSGMVGLEETNSFSSNTGMEMPGPAKGETLATKDEFVLQAM